MTYIVPLKLVPGFYSIIYLFNYLFSFRNDLIYVKSALWRVHGDLLAEVENNIHNYLYLQIIVFF